MAEPEAEPNPGMGVDATAGPPEHGPETAAGPPLDARQRLALRVVLAILGLAHRLPDRPLYRCAFAVGAGVSLLMPARRARVRGNLLRVCTWLVANDMANPKVARAARQPAALDRLVRATFGHWLVSYVEAALAPRYGAAELARRIRPVDATLTADAMMARAPGQIGPIHLAMHFGSVELSALYGARVGGLPVTGPMESVSDPLARAYFDHVRGGLGITIVPLEGAARSLAATLRRGEAVGVVADRNVLGKGAAVDFFGAPARFPIGPAVLSVQTGAPLYLQAIERVALGAWRGHTVPIGAVPGTSRREAARSIVEQQARAFERIIALAPEQWTTLLFPIWEDEEGV